MHFRMAPNSVDCPPKFMVRNHRTKYQRDATRFRTIQVSQESVVRVFSKIAKILPDKLCSLGIHMPLWAHRQGAGIHEAIRVLSYLWRHSSVLCDQLWRAWAFTMSRYQTYMNSRLAKRLRQQHCSHTCLSTGTFPSLKAKV